MNNMTSKLEQYSRGWIDGTANKWNYSIDDNKYSNEYVNGYKDGYKAFKCALVAVCKRLNTPLISTGDE